MDVDHPENSSDTCWEGSGIRISSKINFTVGVLELYWRRHVGAQSQLSALTDPQLIRKIEIGTRDHSENRPESPLDPDFHPVVVKIAKNRFLGSIWGQKRSQKGL